MRRRQSQRVRATKADKGGSEFFAAQIYIEAHFADRKSLV
jgi:hypothetical protein